MENIRDALESYEHNMSVINKAFGRVKHNTLKLSILFKRMFKGPEGEDEAEQDKAVLEELKPEAEDEDEEEDGSEEEGEDETERAKTKVFNIRKVLTGRL